MDSMDDEQLRQAFSVIMNLKDKNHPAIDNAIEIVKQQRHAAQTNVSRFEVIDHRQCVWCRGRMTANYAQKDGSYKEMPCNKCQGSGMMGGRVYSVSSNPERSMINVYLSYQDNGRTLKVFISDQPDVKLDVTET